MFNIDDILNIIVIDFGSSSDILTSLGYPLILISFLLGKLQ